MDGRPLGDGGVWRKPGSAPCPSPARALADFGHQRSIRPPARWRRVAGFELGLLEHLLGRVERALQQVGGHVLELLAADRHRQALSFVAAMIVVCSASEQRDLGLVAVVPQSSATWRATAADVEVVPRLEFVGHVVQDAVVPIDAAQLHVAVGGQHLKMGRRVADHGDVERAAPQVVHQGLARTLEGLLRGPQLATMPGIGQRGGGRLVDDVDDVQAGDLAGVLRSLCAGRR